MGKKKVVKGTKGKIPNDVYQAELFRLQTELVTPRLWAKGRPRV